LGCLDSFSCTYPAIEFAAAAPNGIVDSKGVLSEADGSSDACEASHVNLVASVG
jgi:hypothetical protein